MTWQNRPGRRAHAALRQPGGEHRRQGQRQARDEHPADHLLGAQLRRQLRAGHESRSRRSRPPPAAPVGGDEPAAAAQCTAKPDHQRATRNGAQPEARRRPLARCTAAAIAVASGRNCHDGGVHRVDFAQRGPAAGSRPPCPRRKRRASATGCALALGPRSTPGRPGWTGQPPRRAGGHEAGGSCGSPAGPTASQVIGSVSEDRDPEQAGQAARRVAHGRAVQVHDTSDHSKASPCGRGEHTGHRAVEPEQALPVREPAPQQRADQRVDELLARRTPLSAAARSPPLGPFAVDRDPARADDEREYA